MKSLLVSSLFVLISVTSFGADYMKGKYEVDPAHTRVSFVVPHFVVSEVEGRFNDVAGDFNLNDTFTKSTFTATVQTKSIDTGVSKRDDHLRSKDFFEVEKYPTMKMVSKSMTGDASAFRVVIAVTIKDVTKNIPFDGKYTGSAKDPWGGQRAALQLTGKVNRKDFHINYDDKISIGDAVGNDVVVTIRTEGVLAVNKK
ncbi:MAG: YceI family protein [Bdellovibrio sp.]|nr:YceI family protein [Bdellovibrio sp.]